MATLISGIVAVVVLYTLLQMLRSANPAVMARAARYAGGVLALGVAAFTGLRGELVVAIPLGLFGAGLLGWVPLHASLAQFESLFGLRGRQHVARVRYLEIVTDASGAIEGRIVAGPNAGRSLGEFNLDGLLALASTFDAESAALLESYLDRRFPAWREHSQRDAAGGQRSRAAGKMSDEEAYQILGLQAGASRADISSAHRSLMKKLHPDQGGSTYLAARVNEAKDTLLRTHRS